MPKKISTQEVRDIMRFSFEGYSVKEVANMVGVSDRTIRNKIIEFDSRCRKVDIKVAAKEMGINVDDLLKVASEKRRYALEFDEIAIGVKVATSCKELGCEQKNVQKLLDLIHRHITVSGYEPMLFADNAFKLQQVTDKLGTTYENAVNLHEELHEKITRLNSEIKETNKALQEAKESLSSQLKNNETTLEEINDFTKVRNQLKEYGLEIMDVAGLATLISNVSQYTEDPEVLAKHYRDTSDASAYYKSLLEKNDILKSENAELERLNQELAQQVTKSQLLVDAAKKLAEAEITPEAAAQLSQTVKDIAVKHGCPKTLALTKLTQDLADHYDPILGLDARYKRLQEEYTSTQSIYNNLVEQRKGLCSEYNKELSTVKMLQTLNQKGVSNTDIVEWYHILEENNLDANHLRREIRKLEGLPQTIRETRKNLAELEAKQLELFNEVNILESRKDTLTHLIDNIQQEITKQLKELTQDTRGMITKLDEQLFSPKTGLQPQSEALVKQTVQNISNELNKSSKIWDMSLHKLESTIDDSAKIVAELENKTYDAGKVIGSLVNLESVTKLAQGKQITEIEANIAVLSLTATMLGYVNNKYMSKSKIALDRFLTSYMEESSNIP